MKQSLPPWLTGISLAGFALLASLTASAGTISGRVFEDVNYGGGRGAAYATTGGFSLRPGARVELYNTNTGAFINSATTNASGAYSITFTGANNLDLTVRVVSATVTSSRGNGLTPVVTYRSFYTGNRTYTRNDDYAYVGGQNPAVADGIANANSQSLTGVGAQVYTTVLDADNDDAFTDVDFGFSFDVITNTNDAGQGSLRQFVLNANALSNTTINQRRFNNNGTLAGPTFPAGQETSIFMIPDGTVRPGLRAGLTSQLTNAAGTAVTNNTASRALLTLASALPTLTDAATAIDGTTQTTLFNSNPTLLGTGGAVGTAGTALNKLAGPEVELSTASTAGLTIAANNCVVRGLALHGGTSETLRANSGTNLLVENCGIGLTAFDVSTPATNPTGNVGLALFNLSGTVQNNLLLNCGSSGINYSGSAGTGSGYLITGNELQQNGRTMAGGDNITLGDQSAGATGPVTISNNLIAFANSSGIQLEIGRISNNTITGNTIRDNGKGGPTSRLEGSGIHYLQRSNPATTLVLSANADVISSNIIATNQSSAVVINYGQRQVHVTQNSIYGNGDGTTGGKGLIAVDFTPIDYHVGGNSAYGQGDGVTPNDGTLDANKVNGGMNYSIITKKNVTINGAITTLHVEGFVGKQAGQTLFANTELEFYRGDNTTDANQNGEVIAGDKNNFPHGEPRTYIGTITTGNTGSFSADIVVATASISPALQTSDPINSLAYKAEYGTSEAGINLIPNTIPPGVLPVKLVRFDAQASAAGVLLTWATATELNNDYFEVQRSRDGLDFETLGRVAGHRTTNKAQAYAYTDEAALPAGPSYYRLRQVDADGTATYSPVRVVSRGSTAALALPYPNPTADYTGLDLSALPSGEYQLLVTDLTGRTVATQSAQGGQVASLNLRALAAGTYLVRLTGGASTFKWRVSRK